jgi:UDP-N-acetylenolpyruvoylglucosamine reductase
MSDNKFPIILKVVSETNCDFIYRSSQPQQIARIVTVSVSLEDKRSIQPDVVPVGFDFAVARSASE